MPLSGGDVHVPHPIWRGGDPHYSAIPIIITVPDCSIGVVHRDVRLLYVHILWASSRPSPLFLAGGGGSHRACTLRGPPGGPIYSTPYGPCPYRPTVGNPTTQPKCQYTKAKHTFLAEMVSGQHAVSFRHDGRWGNVKEGNWGQEEVVFVSFRRTTSRRTLTSKTGEGRELGAGGGFFSLQAYTLSAYAHKENR